MTISCPLCKSENVTDLECENCGTTGLVDNTEFIDDTNYDDNICEECDGDGYHYGQLECLDCGNVFFIDELPLDKIG